MLSTCRVQALRLIAIFSILIAVTGSQSVQAEGTSACEKVPNWTDETYSPADPPFGNFTVSRSDRAMSNHPGGFDDRVALTRRGDKSTGPGGTIFGGICVEVFDFPNETGNVVTATGQTNFGFYNHFLISNCSKCTAVQLRNIHSKITREIRTKSGDRSKEDRKLDTGSSDQLEAYLAKVETKGYWVLDGADGPNTPNRPLGGLVGGVAPGIGYDVDPSQKLAIVGIDVASVTLPNPPALPPSDHKDSTVVTAIYEIHAQFLTVFYSAGNKLTQVRWGYIQTLAFAEGLGETVDRTCVYDPDQPWIMVPADADWAALSTAADTILTRVRDHGSSKP